MKHPTGYEPLFWLKPVAPNVWIADGGWIGFYGLPFPTRMTVIRLADGSIWVHSPIANENGLAEAVAAEPVLVRTAQKGVIHKKTASRKVSRLAARVKALGAAHA